MKSSNRHLAAILAIILATLAMNCTCLASQAGRMFNEADKELNVAYQQALSGITDAKQKELFVESQRAWVKYRDANVAFFAARYPYSKGGLFFNLDLTRKRTDYLKSVHATSPAKTPEGPSDCQDG